MTAGTDRYDAAICALMALQYAAKGASPVAGTGGATCRDGFGRGLGLPLRSPLINRIGPTSPIRPLAGWLYLHLHQLVASFHYIALQPAALQPCSLQPCSLAALQPCSLAG